MGLFDQFSYVNFQQLNLDPIWKKMGEISKEIDGLLDEAKAYTDQIKAEVDEELAAALLEVDAKITAAEARFNELIEQTEAEIQQLLERSYIYTDEQISILRQYVDEELEKAGSNVFNPIRGTYTTASVAIADLYALHTTGTLTAEEYDNLELTAANYDAREITAIDYDLRGKELLM